jgi:hypothetical protein
MPENLHLLVPYAACTPPGCQQALQTLQLPHLQRLLGQWQVAHSHLAEETSRTPPHEHALAQALGLPTDDGRIPWAAWHHHQAGHATGDAAWAWVTPCQWQVGADHVTMGHPDALGLDEAASRSLLDVVAPWFAQDDLHLQYVSPTRWLAHGPLLQGLATTSLDRVLQRDVRPWMPDPTQARPLHRLHSEMQMLLYTHPYNDTRAAQGLPPINAFWVHGAGALPTPPTSATPPTTDERLRTPALQENWEAWAQVWQALDAGPVADLLQKASQGHSVRLTLCGERGHTTWHNAPRSLGQKIQSFLRPYRSIDKLFKL